MGGTLFIEIGFWTEGAMGLLLFIGYALSIVPMETDLSRALTMAGASILCIAGDSFLILGIEIGIVGAVVALVASNFMLVTLFSAIVLGNALTTF